MLFRQALSNTGRLSNRRLQRYAPSPSPLHHFVDPLPRMMLPIWPSSLALTSLEMSVDKPSSWMRVIVLLRWPNSNANDIPTPSATDARTEETADGSLTLGWNSSHVTYRSRYGAWTEANHVFVKAPTRSRVSRPHIFEFGLGAATNFRYTRHLRPIHPSQS